MKAVTIVYIISLIAVFIAAFSLFYIFDNMQKSKELFGPAGNALGIITTIGGLLTVIPAVAHLMLSAQRI